jgi:trans-AT polyketide synthase/acyltransferase/oxidoreductase domain-containing protein
MSIIVFPGQGAQFKGMCAELFNEYKELCHVADKILGYSIRDLCLQDADKCLNLTQFTQPALYTVNAFSYFHHLKSNSAPQALAGHSLGEYNALLAAGVFDFETGLKLVQKRGQLMSKVQNGGMLAIIRSSEEQVKKVLDDQGLNSIDIANYNSPSQLVLSGKLENIEKAKLAFSAAKIFCVPLKVSGAFHSRYMETAAVEYQQFLDEFEFNNLKIPVIANVTAHPYQQGQIKQMLVKQLSHSVQWTDSIRYLIALESGSIMEIGPGNILTKLNDDIAKNCKPLSINSMLIKNKTEPKPPLKGGFSLGSRQFLQDYGVRYAYIAGSMCNGISSTNLVVKMAKAGFLAFLGSHGLTIPKVESLIQSCKCELTPSQQYGINVHYVPSDPIINTQLIELCIKHELSCIEVSGFDHISIDLVKYRVKGLLKEKGCIISKNKILVKTSQSKTAEIFMQAAPLHILEKLLAEKVISNQQFELAQVIPMADDICVEGHGGWKTEQAVTLTKLPEIIQLRDKYRKSHTQSPKIRIGCCGGLATPQSIAAVFMLGAEFVLTGSINQCTVEAAISEHSKNLLQKCKVDDSSCVPAGDLFESGAKVQVLRKGTFFPARAQKLYDLYRLNDKWDDVEEHVRQQIEKHFFNRSFISIYQEISKQFSQSELNEAAHNQKFQMAQVFKWYFQYCKNLAIEGSPQNQQNYQIFNSSALGAFNQLVMGDSLEKWQNRHVDEIAIWLLKAAHTHIENKLKAA